MKYAGSKYSSNPTVETTSRYQSVPNVNLQNYQNLYNQANNQAGFQNYLNLSLQNVANQSQLGNCLSGLGNSQGQVGGLLGNLLGGVL